MIIPPAETIKDEIVFLNMSQQEFADKLGLDITIVNEILNSNTPITNEIAIKLENVLGIPTSTWINLESNYRNKLKVSELLEIVKRILSYKKEED